VEWQRPQTRAEANADALREVEWMFDGLNKHPNVVVAVSAATVALPISLWKQTVATARGVQPQSLRKAEARLSQVAARTQPHEQLALQLAQCLIPQTSQHVLLVNHSAPSEPASAAALSRRSSHGPDNSLPQDQTVNRHLPSQDADLALEIDVRSARLDGDAGINPKLALCVEAQATLVRRSDGEVLYSQPVRYRGNARTLLSWAAREAKPFRSELQHCYTQMSSALVKQLLERGMVPDNAVPQATFANIRGPAKLGH
jgi:hypothetical protein